MTTARKPAPRAATKPAAKKPADRKPKVIKQAGIMSANVRGKQWKIKEEVLNDWEIMEMIGIIEHENNPAPMPIVLRALLGEEQYSQAKELIRDKKTGKITVEEGSKFLGEIFETFAPNS